MSVWQVQPLAKRYLRGAPPVRRVWPPHPPRTAAPHPAPTAAPPTSVGGRTTSLGQRLGTSIVPAMGRLLGGYALVAALGAWMVTKGDPEHDPIRALAPIGLLISILVGVGALGVTVFAGRRYLALAMATLGLSVGTAVASAGALVTASF
jgi:hypothetical protein